MRRCVFSCYHRTRNSPRQGRLDMTEADRIAAVLNDPHPPIRWPIRDTRACPGCGRPQHYTGIELGWCHDATWATWDCADPRKLRPGEFCGCPGDTHLPVCPASASTERARQIIADPFAAAFDGVEEAEF